MINKLFEVITLDLGLENMFIFKLVCIKFYGIVMWNAKRGGFEYEMHTF